jgi:hypothetical protein
VGAFVLEPLNHLLGHTVVDVLLAVVTLWCIADGVLAGKAGRFLIGCVLLIILLINHYAAGGAA